MRVVVLPRYSSVVYRESSIAFVNSSGVRASARAADGALIEHFDDVGPIALDSYSVQRASARAAEAWVARGCVWLELAKRAVDVCEDAGFRAYLVSDKSVVLEVDERAVEFSLSVRGLRELAVYLEGL